MNLSEISKIKQRLEVSKNALQSLLNAKGFELITDANYLRVVQLTLKYRYVFSIYNAFDFMQKGKDESFKGLLFNVLTEKVKKPFFNETQMPNARELDSASIGLTAVQVNLKTKELRKFSTKFDLRSKEENEINNRKQSIALFEEIISLLSEIYNVDYGLVWLAKQHMINQVKELLYEY